MAKPNLKLLDSPASAAAPVDPELEEMLYARNAEIETLNDLAEQRGTPIPALFNTFYKFVQNPSVISVETFKRMVDTDDTIGSGVDLLTTCMAARLGSYQHPNEEVQRFVNEVLDRIEGGFHSKIKELLSATWAGFAVQEMVWVDDPDLGWVPRKLVTMPPSTMLFETERTGELTSDGILQYQRNYNPFLLGRGLGYFGGLVSGGVGFSVGFTGKPDPLAKYGDLPFPLRTANTFNYLSIRIPTAKCLHYAFDAQGKFGNPYGRSLLRRIYKYYVVKDAILQMMVTALDRKGTPLTVVWADPNQTLESVEKNQSGQNPREMRGQGVRGDKAAQLAFKNIHNDSVIILPGKKGEQFDVETLSQQSNTGDFLEALRFCNSSIMRGLLIPSLLLNGGDGTGSYSLGQEHAETFNKIIDGANAHFEAVLIQQLIARAIRMNFPESAWKKDGFGSFGKRELTQDEINKEMETIERAVNIGAVDMNDLNDLNTIRSKINLEPRTRPIEPPVTPFGNEEGENEFAPEEEKAGGKSENGPLGKTK